MAIKIITDTGSCITIEEAKKYDIELIPIEIIINEKSYKDQYEITNEEFYELQENLKELPKSSQPSPVVFSEIFQHAKNNNDEVVCILLSSKLSGTYNSALIAYNEVGYDKVYIIDSLSTISNQKILVLEAIKLRDNGVCGKDIYQEILKLIPRVKIYAVIDCLKYLFKGGRLSKAGYALGSVLQIKPVINLEGGTVNVIEKSIKFSKALINLGALVEFEKIDFNYPVIYGYTKTTDNMEKLIDLMNSKGITYEYSICHVPAVIGVHVGPNCCAIAYVLKENN